MGKGRPRICTTRAYDTEQGKGKTSRFVEYFCQTVCIRQIVLNVFLRVRCVHCKFAYIWLTTCKAFGLVLGYNLVRATYTFMCYIDVMDRLTHLKYHPGHFHSVLNRLRNTPTSSRRTSKSSEQSSPITSGTDTTKTRAGGTKRPASDDTESSVSCNNY